MIDVGIADRLRAAGLRVVEVAGWRTRGSSTFDPAVSVNHHTAAGGTGILPSLRALIDGKPGVPGPLCNVAQSRDPNEDDSFYVIAAGRANHAGLGGWAGFSGNSRAWGLEIEHNGISQLSVKRQRLAARCHAALIGSLHWSRVCQHREWANTPPSWPGRKIDAATGVNGDQFRQFVAEYQQTGTGPVPQPSGDWMTVLPCKYPAYKIGPNPAAGNRIRFFTHNDSVILSWNGASIGGDFAFGGSDADSMAGKVPRVKTFLPAGAVEKVIGICYGVKPDGTDDVRFVWAAGDRGGTFGPYDVT